MRPWRPMLMAVAKLLYRLAYPHRHGPKYGSNKCGGWQFIRFRPRTQYGSAVVHGFRDDERYYYVEINEPVTLEKVSGALVELDFHLSVDRPPLHEYVEAGTRQ